MSELIRTLQRGKAAQAAEDFGIAEIGLRAGHAFGQNIVTGFGDVPTLDLASVYVQMAGIEAAFLMDATSYAWDSNGLVVSSDLMLLGATGYYGASAPASSWVRLPVPSGGLNASPVPENGVAAKANSIAIPAGFNPKDPASVAAALALLPTNGSDTFSKSQVDDVGLIGPALEIELLEIGSGPVLEVVDYGYALTLPAETFSLATGGVVEVVDGVPVPAAALTVAALPPVVGTGVAVSVTAGDVVVQGLPPVVGTGVAVSVTAGDVVVQGLPPVVGTGVAVSVTAGDVVVQGLAPVVGTGVAVQVPAAQVVVQGLAPVVGTGVAVQVPAAQVVVQGLAPVVAIGAAVSLPVGVVTVAALPPVITRGPAEVVVPQVVVVTAALAPAVVTGEPLTLGSVISIAALAPAVVTGEPLTLGSVISIAALPPAVVAEAPPAPAGGDELAFWGWQEPGVLVFGEAPEN